MVDEQDDPSSSSGNAARYILNEVVSGTLRAGTKLRIRELVVRTGLGPTPIREGLSRLLASGLIQAKDQQGFIVKTIEVSDLEDYTTFRLLLEKDALQQSILIGDDRWVNSIESALWELANFVPASRTHPRVQLRNYSELHRRFHVSLTAASQGARALHHLSILHLHEMFFCNNLVAETDPLEDLINLHSVEEHRALATCAIARDSRQACALLEQHQRNLTKRLLKKMADAPQSRMGRKISSGARELGS